MPEEFPEWLRKGSLTKIQAEEQLTSSREELFKALELYHIHVKHVIGIMFAIVTGLVAILGLTSRFGGGLDSAREITMIVSIMMMCMPVVGFLSIIILYRYYQVYLSALIFCVRVHCYAEIPYSHPWLVRTLNQAKDWTSVKTEAGFLKKRAFSITDTFALYSSVVAVVSSLSALCGFLLMF